MNKQEENEKPLLDESMTSDSESDSDSSDSSDGTIETDCEADGIVGDENAPFRFIFGEEAQSRSLDGIAYGIDKDGHYFVICKDGDTVDGLLVHALIESNVKDGILLPIIKPEAKTNPDSVGEK